MECVVVQGLNILVNQTDLEEDSDMVSLQGLILNKRFFKNT